MINEITILEAIDYSLQILLTEGFINNRKVEQTERLLETTKIIILDSSSFIGSACVIHRPQCINDQLKCSFTLRIAQRKEQQFEHYVMLHEISHFITIGDIVKINNEIYERKWGICKSLYIAKEGTLIENHIRNDESDNEKINECLASFLYERYYNELPYERFLRRRGDFALWDQHYLLINYLANKRC